MPGSVEFANPLRYPGWDDLLLASDDRDFFHTTSWAAVLSETYGYEPVYRVTIDRGRCRDLLPVMEIRSRLTGVRGVSLPFTDACTSILTDANAFEAMLAGVLEEGRRRGWKYLELRGCRGISPEIPRASAYLRHTLGLTTSHDALFNACSENTRRNIRMAQQEGVTVSAKTGTDALAEFYRLHCLTRKRHGVPPPPFRFFENLYTHVLASGRGMIMLASVDRRVVAGAVFFRFADRAIFKYGASDVHFQRHRANHLLMWEAIRNLSSEGCSELSFGRTDIGDDGLRRFKNGWGTFEEPLAYYRYDLVGDRFLENVPLRGSQGRRVLSNVPLFLLRAAGSVLYRHIG